VNRQQSYSDGATAWLDCSRGVASRSGELAWEPVAAGVGGEGILDSLERALELKRRGCVVTPDPTDPGIQAAYRAGVVREFARHGRPAFVEG